VEPPGSESGNKLRTELAQDNNNKNNSLSAAGARSSICHWCVHWTRPIRLLAVPRSVPWPRRMLAIDYSCMRRIALSFISIVNVIRIHYRYYTTSLLGAQTVPPVDAHSSFRVPSVCHILLKLCDVFRRHSANPVTHCQMGFATSQASRDLVVEPPPSRRQNTQLQIAAKPSVLCCHLANTNEDSNSVFYQITLFLVVIVIVMILNPSSVLGSPGAVYDVTLHSWVTIGQWCCIAALTHWFLICAIQTKALSVINVETSREDSRKNFKSDLKTVISYIVEQTKRLGHATQTKKKQCYEFPQFRKSIALNRVNTRTDQWPLVSSVQFSSVQWCHSERAFTLVSMPMREGGDDSWIKVRERNVSLSFCLQLMRSLLPAQKNRFNTAGVIISASFLTRITQNDNCKKTHL